MFVTELSQNPEQGIHLGSGVYKIRIAVASKGKGKSGGARVITQFKIVRQTVYLVSIYDKSEKENISDADLQLLLRKIN